MEDDILQPYGTSGHGPAHSHRYVRAVLLGNVTHETWPPSSSATNHSSSSSSTAPPVESTVFVTDVPGSSRWVYGTYTHTHTGCCDFMAVLLNCWIPEPFCLVSGYVARLPFIFFFFQRIFASATNTPSGSFI